MTREERENAIEWFTMLKEKFVNTVYEKYLEMAIKSLEQEPKTDNQVKPELDGVKTELENCITIDGIRYIAEEPKLKTVHKDGEVVIGGFKEEQE